MSLKMRVLITGVKVKLSRGEDLEDILTSYVNLTEGEKQAIRDKINQLEGD